MNVGGQRRLGAWIVGGGAAFSVLLSAAIVGWIWLPRWAPEWVLVHSPWLQPALRAGVQMYEATPWGPYDHRKEYLRDWRIGEVPGLIAILDGNEEVLRQSATEALGYIDDPRAFARLVTALASDGDPRVRGYAARALGNEHHAGAAPALMSGLRDADPFVRTRALESLNSVADADCIAGLMAFIASSDVVDTCERLDAVRLLGYIDNPRISGQLVSLLQDGDVHIRGEAARSLRLHPGPGVAVALETLLDDPGVCTQSAETLREHDDPESSRVIAAFLTRTACSCHEASELRVQMVRCLAHRKDQYARVAMFAALTDPNGLVVQAATSAFAIHRAEDLPRLDPLLTSPDERLRLIGLRLCYEWKARSRPSDPVSGRPLEGAMPVTAEVPPAAHLALLIELLGDSALEVRRVAIQILAEYQDPRSVDPLIRVLSTTADGHLRRSTRRLLLHGFMLAPEQRNAVDRVP